MTKASILPLKFEKIDCYSCGQFIENQIKKEKIITIKICQNCVKNTLDSAPDFNELLNSGKLGKFLFGEEF